MHDTDRVQIDENLKIEGTIWAHNTYEPSATITYEEFDNPPHLENVFFEIDIDKEAAIKFIELLTKTFAL